MMQHEIFEGLFSSVEVARDLATYHRVADGVIGVIDAKGHLITKKKMWPRPMAGRQFEKLKAALEGNEAEAVIVYNDYIVVDFPALKYNLDWVREQIQSKKVGVKDSPEGLVLFQKKESKNMPLWYSRAYWALKGVTVEELQLELQKEVVSISANPENPDDADWTTLYFAA